MTPHESALGEWGDMGIISYRNIVKTVGRKILALAEASTIDPELIDVGDIRFGLVSGWKSTQLAIVRTVFSLFGRTTRSYIG
jgi:hypothetical protein